MLGLMNSGTLGKDVMGQRLWGKGSKLAEAEQGLFMQGPLRVLSSLEDKDALSSGYKEGMFHMRVYDLFQEKVRKFFHYMLFLKFL